MQDFLLWSACYKAFTILFQIKPTSVSNAWIIGKGIESTGWEFKIGFSGGNFVFTLKTITSNGRTVTTQTQTVTEASHGMGPGITTDIAARYNGTDIRLYRQHGGVGGAVQMGSTMSLDGEMYRSEHKLTFG